MKHWGVVPVLQPSCSPGLVRYLAVPSCWQSMTCGLTLSHPAVLPICAALQEKKTVQVLFLVQLTLLFWGRQALYLEIRSVSVCQKEPYAIQPAQGYCQSYCWVSYFLYFTKVRSCTGLSALLLSTENILCLLNSLHAFLVQLTVKTGEVEHIETPQKLV